MRRFLRRLSLLISPIKEGDIFYGNSKDFVKGLLDRTRHNLTLVSGEEKLFHFHGLETYRITIKSTHMPYYIYQGEVLTKPINPTEFFVWSPKISVTRQWKKDFHEMFLDGKLRRVN